MKAKDLTKGMTIETDKGVKVVRTSSAYGDRLWRVAFADAVTICLCPPETDFTVLQPEQTP
jgi:hypothetical protein